MMITFPIKRRQRWRRHLNLVHFYALSGHPLFLSLQDGSQDVPPVRNPYHMMCSRLQAIYTHSLGNYAQYKWRFARRTSSYFTRVSGSRRRNMRKLLNSSFFFFFFSIHGHKLFRPPVVLLAYENSHLSCIVSTVLPIAALSALIASLGVSFSGNDLKQQETNFSATELIFNMAFFSICHSSRITCVGEQQRKMKSSGEIIFSFF